MFHFTKKEPGAPVWLLAGLGNPGAKYEFTRHNAGFLCLDVLANEYSLKIDRSKFQSLTCDTRIDGHRCILLRPQTYMNNSGQAVRAAADFYKVPPERVLVIFDDVSLPCGALRIRRKGSAGGHNGIKSIIQHLGTEEFPRIKLGVGSKPHPDYDLIDWVMTNFTANEQKQMRQAMEQAVQAVPLILTGDMDGAMNQFNA